MKRFLTLLIIALSLVFINHSCKPKEEEEPEPGSIYGVVTDKATGEPVKTAGVELSPLGLKTVTGSEGQFEFNELEAGEYKLFVTKTGYTEHLSSTIIVKSAQTAKGDVQIEKLPAALKVVDDKGEEISELDFGNQYDDVSRMFSIFNDGTEVLNYEIVKTASWITSLSVTEGTLQPGATKPVVVNIDREKLQVGENTTTLHITSNNGSKQLTIHVEKLPTALSVVDKENKSIDELDFGNNPTETSRTFYLYNNAKPSLNYQITKDVEWISSISSTQGTIEGNAKVSIVVLINRDKLSIGENITTLNIQSDNGGKQLTVKANKLAPELMLVDDNGKEITEVNYGSNFDNLSRSFNVFNNGTTPLDYQINESAEWLTVSNQGGTIQGGVKVPITITIDLNKLAVGENSSIINVTSEYGNKQLTVKANKLAPELVILNDAGNEITEIDYASNFENLSRQFNLMNNGVVSLNYQISKSVDWLTLSNESGSLNSKETKPIFITIDINKLPIGENSTLLNISSEYGNKQLTVKANKLAPELVILNDAGNEITEIDYASNFDNLSRQFNIRNNGIVALNYQISKTVDWLTINNTEGMLQAGAMSSVVITIDINKLPVGNNTAMLSINSEYGNKQLTVKANKLAPELVILNDAGNEITEIDYASNFDNLSRQFNIRNNGIVALNYQISKTVDWLTINNTEGMLQAGAMSSVVITIDINKLPVGNNTAMLSINSEYGNKQLAVKANKLAPELVIDKTSLDFGSGNTSSLSITITNNSYSSINYNISKTENWIGISNAQGVLQAKATQSVIVTVNRNIMPLGDSDAVLLLTSDIGNKQINVTCTINGSVITNEASNVGSTSADLNGKLEGNFSYSEKGFYFGKNVNCDTKYIVSGSGTGAFSYNISGLEEGVKYYFKSYVIRNEEIIFGDVKEFTTKLFYYDHEYVDLGLPSGLRWATCNSGAGSPEEYGNYLTFEEAEDATWGGNWRCPTKSEWEELKSNCAWTWTTKDGVKGYEVVGSNGNSIFLPAAGCRYGSSLDDVGSGGDYWSSTPIDSNNAYYLDFDSSGQSMDNYHRSGGLSVRLVAE